MARTTRLMSSVVMAVVVAGCGTRVDYVDDSTGVPLPCREAGRIRSMAPVAASVGIAGPATTIEVMSADHPGETVLVKGRPPNRMRGRRIKICDERLLLINGQSPSGYAIVAEQP